MAQLDVPSSDLKRLGLLKEALACYTKAKEEGKPCHIDDEIMEAVVAFLPEFEPLHTTLTEKLRDRIKEIGEKDVALAVVAMYLRDLWDVLKRRVRRENQPAEVLVYYKLPMDGTVPGTGSGEAMLTLAEQVVQGDSKAVEAGYAAMINPSAAELDAKVQKARKEKSEADSATEEHAKLQKDIAALRPRADELVGDILDSLRYHTRKMEPALQRSTMRSYGVKFTYGPGEPHDDDDEQGIGGILGG